MTLQGDLESFYIASVLQLLAGDRKSGILDVETPADRFKVYFREGKIVYASTPRKSFQLGHLLKTRGAITEEALTNYLAKAQKDKKMLGKILVDEGIITNEQLVKYLQHQAREIVCEIFLLQDGSFEFKEVPVNISSGVAAEIDPVSIILEATRRLDEWKMFSEHIPHDLYVLLKVPGKEPPPDLSSDKIRLLELIDGQRSIREVVHESGFDTYRAHKIISSFITSGLAELSEEIKAADPSMVEEVPPQVEQAALLLEVYGDVLAAVRQSLEREIGEKFFNLYDQSLERLTPSKREVVEPFDLRKGTKWNAQAVMSRIRDRLDAEGVDILNDSFSSLVNSLFTRATDLLGRKMVKSAVEDVYKVLGYVKKYRGQELDLSELKKTLERFEETGEKKSGLFGRRKK